MNNELQMRPIGSVITDPEVVKLRQNIAMQMELKAMDMDQSTNNFFRKIYEEFPRWKFYTDSEHKCVFRVYGIHLRNDKKVELKVNECCEDGELKVKEIAKENVQPLLVWNAQHRQRIAKSKHKGLFLDPIAWLEICSLSTSGKSITENSLNEENLKELSKLISRTLRQDERLNSIFKRARIECGLNMHESRLSLDVEGTDFREGDCCLSSKEWLCIMFNENRIPNPVTVFLAMKAVNVNIATSAYYISGKNTWLDLSPSLQHFLQSLEKHFIPDHLWKK